MQMAEPEVDVVADFGIFTASQNGTWWEFLGRPAVHHPDGHVVGGHRPPSVHQKRMPEPERKAGVALQSHQIRAIFVL